MPPPDKLKIKSKLSLHREYSCAFRRVTVKVQFPGTERISMSVHPEVDSAASFSRLMLSSPLPSGDPRCLLHSPDEGFCLFQPCERLGKFCADNSWRVCPTEKSSFVKISKTCCILMQKKAPGRILDSADPLAHKRRLDMKTHL